MLAALRLVVALLVIIGRSSHTGPPVPQPGMAIGAPCSSLQVNGDCLLTLSRCRRPVRPSWCGLLLATCLLSGDVHPNPGPGNNNVTILAQNVQSVKNKLGDLRQSAAELEKFSAVAWSETWLNDTVASSELEAALPGHELFRRDRVGRVGGGVSCFVRRSLCPERREALEPEGAEMLVVSVQTVPPMFVAVCYCPPDDAAALATTMTGLSDLVTAAAGRVVVAVGDLTCRASPGRSAAPGKAEGLSRRWCDAAGALWSCWTAVIWPALYSM